MTKDELIELAQVGMRIHSPNAPEYKICAALIAEYRKKDSVIYGVDWGTAGDMPCVSIIKELPDGKIEVLAVEYSPQRKPLSDEEMKAVVEQELVNYWDGEYIDTTGARDCLTKFARAIEAAHGIKEKQ